MKGRWAERFAFLLLSAFLILASLLQASARGDECFGPVVELDADGQGPKFGVLGGFGSNLTEPLVSLKLVAANPADACGELAGALAGEGGGPSHLRVERSARDLSRPWGPESTICSAMQKWARTKVGTRCINGHALPA